VRSCGDLLLPSQLSLAAPRVQTAELTAQAPPSRTLVSTAASRLHSKVVDVGVGVAHTPRATKKIPPATLSCLQPPAIMQVGFLQQAARTTSVRRKDLPVSQIAERGKLGHPPALSLFSRTYG